MFASDDRAISRLGPIRKERVLVHDREFVLVMPERTAGQAAYAENGGVSESPPYWSELWPAARMLAKTLWREPLPVDGPALEIGCGLGLPGIVALSRGLKVTFTDHDPCALHFAAQNARLNGFTDFETQLVDWCRPPEGLRVPVLLGADLIYELSKVEPLVEFIKKSLAADGVCLLTDQDRLPAHALRAELDRQGLSHETEVVRAGEPGGRRLKGTLYRIRAR